MSEGRQGAELSRGSVADLRSSLFGGLAIGANYFKPGLQIHLATPRWQKACPLVFMPLPVISREDGNRLLPPYNYVSGQFQPTDYFVRLPTVNYMGSAKRVEFPLFDPYLEARGGYDVQSNPYIVLRSAVRDQVKKGRKEWSTLLQQVEGDTDSAVLPKQTETYFFSALVFQEEAGFVGDIKGNPMGFRDRDVNFPIVALKRGLGQRVVSMIEEFMRGTEAFPGGRNLLAGDEHSHYFVIYNPAHHMESSFDPVAAASATAAVMVDPTKLMSNSLDAGQWAAQFSSMGATDDEGSRASTDARGYEIAALPRVTVNIKVAGKTQLKPIAMNPFSWMTSPHYQELFVRRWSPLHQFFMIPTHKEQIRMICDALSDKPEILEVAFPPNSEYYTEDVDRVLRNRRAMRISLDGLGDVVQGSSLDQLANLGQSVAGSPGLGGPTMGGADIMRQLQGAGPAATKPAAASTMSTLDSLLGDLQSHQRVAGNDAYAGTRAAM